MGGQLVSPQFRAWGGGGVGEGGGGGEGAVCGEPTAVSACVCVLMIREMSACLTAV